MSLIDALRPRQRESALDHYPQKASQQRQWAQDIRSWIGRGGASARLARYLTPVAVMDDRLDTVTTDGRHLFFHAAFAAMLTPEERRFITAHLVWHCVCGHIVAQPHRDTQRWNLACEHEANYLVLLEGLNLPRDAVFYFSQAGRHSGQVYDWLAAHPHPQQDHHFDGHPLDTPYPPDEIHRVDPDYAPLEADAALAGLWQKQANREIQAGPLHDYLFSR
ncbi:DUF2201 family putative metallopeptidase [Halomonas sp. NCCP-2165]|nr:hypothetical protein [Halomonas sp. NCCP-2165]GKW47972.1 hypothetical protein NCCP2165_01870 [Halomonas sp. NCCP-2165]